MADSNQVRINELARELEIKAKVLIEYLPEVGVTEKKTHSSSIDNSHAELVRKHFLGLAAQEAAAEAEKTKAAAAKSKPSRPAAAAARCSVTCAGIWSAPSDCGTCCCAVCADRCATGRCCADVRPRLAQRLLARPPARRLRFILPRNQRRLQRSQE